MAHISLLLYHPIICLLRDSATLDKLKFSDQLVGKPFANWYFEENQGPWQFARGPSIVGFVMAGAAGLELNTVRLSAIAFLSGLVSLDGARPTLSRFVVLSDQLSP